MRYYISWTHSDPIYHAHIPQLGVLISPPNVSLSWQIGNWPSLPDALLLDSGAFQYRNHRQTPSAQEVLVRQLQLMGNHPLSVGICSLDMPMLGTRNLAELNRRVARSLDNAQWLIDRALGHELPSFVHPIAVIQGYDVESVYMTARQLEDMGYKRFAIGSLATMTASKRDEVLRRVEAAMEAIGPNLHILGVSSIALLTDLTRLGVASADSGTPMHEAWRGGIFYSRPFRRYKLASPHFVEWRRSYGFAELLETPLPCDCTACVEDSSHIMQPRGKRYVNLRALHNCYHLVRQLDLTLP